MTDLDDRLRRGITALAERVEPESTPDEVLDRIAAGPATRGRSRRHGAFVVAAAVLVVALVGAVLVARRHETNSVHVGPVDSSTTTTGTPSRDAFPPGLRRWGAGPIGGDVGATPIWDGREVVVLGGEPSSGTRPVHVAALDPTSGAWRRLPDLPFADSPREERGVAGVACDGEILVWGLDGQAAVWTTGGSSWRPLPSAPSTPSAALSGQAFCDGSDVLFPAAGRRLSLATLAWRTLAPAPGVGISDLGMVWTGREVVATVLARTGSVAAYDPVSDSWKTIASPPFFTVGPLHLVWTGTRLIGIGDLGQSARYDPSTNRWSLLPAVPGIVGSPSGLVGGALVASLGGGSWWSR